MKFEDLLEIGELGKRVINKFRLKLLKSDTELKILICNNLKIILMEYEAVKRGLRPTNNYLKNEKQLHVTMVNAILGLKKLRKEKKDLKAEIDVVTAYLQRVS